MKPPVVAVAGLSGVGKSTMLARLQNAIAMQILQASALIKEARTTIDGQDLSLDALRAADLDENQRLLVVGFARRVDPAVPLVVLDCHTVIETPGRIVYIDPCVFGAIRIGAIIFLEDDAEEIARRRKNDVSRRRPETATKKISLVQAEAIRHARAIAAALNIQLYAHRPVGEDDAIAERLRSYQRLDGTERPC